MRPFAVAVGLVLLALAPRAAAVDVSGRIGLLYDRTETWLADTRATSPRLQLDGFAQASGALVEPEFGSWRGTLGYQRLRRTFSDATEDSTDALTYSALLALLNDRSAPVSLTASAERVVTDSSSALGDVRITGTRTDNSYGGQLYVNPGTLPKLRVGGWLRESTADGFATARTSEDTKLLEIGAHHGPGPYDFKLAYQGRWNSGTFDILDYVSHTLDVNASSNFGGGVDGFANGRYYLRTPEDSDLGGPRYEQNHLAVGVRRFTADHRNRLQYAYEHLFFTSGATGERERIRQTVSGWTEFIHSPSWESAWNADLSVNQDRASGLEDAAYGASMGPLLRWLARAAHRETLLQAGPTVGVLKPVDAAAELGTGAQWRGRTAWSRAIRSSLEYSGSWGRNLRAVRGWSLHQALTGTLDGPLGLARGHLALTLSANRQHDSIIGDAAARDFVLAGNVAWRRASVQIDAGLRDGTTPAIASIAGDGLFIPAQFDSHSQFVALAGTVELARDLTAVGRARYARLSGPEVAAQQEASVLGSVEYMYGQIRLSLEDRYTLGGASISDRRVNEVIIRASRSFGARY